MKRREFMQQTVAASAGILTARPALAQGHQNVLLSISENGPNSLDVMGIGTNRPGYEVSWNTHDRLMTYGVKQDAGGNDYYDHSKMEPELAEEWDIGDMSLTFKLRRDATFHDGMPVTAKDVKWSFDRMVSIGGAATFQMAAGSLLKPEQFVAVDDHTFRIDLARKDKFALPDLLVPTACIINSGLAQKHASAQDPWAQDWLKTNEAGGGAYRVVQWTPGQELIYQRFDNWKSGPLPKIQRVIWRVVPSAGSRRALLERGDADISFDMPPKDVAEMSRDPKLKVKSNLIESALVYLSMNVKMPPFDKLPVRQAIAYAIPYQKIMDAAMFGRGKPMFGGPKSVATTEWPQPSPYVTDLAKAKQLLVDAGLSNGFETTLSFDLGAAVTQEPLCELVQENLAQLGIRVTLNKVPGANWRTQFAKKTMPFLVNVFGAWLILPDYFFFWNYHGQNSLFNDMSYQNPVMDKLIDTARFETDPQKYDAEVEQFIALAFSDVPRIPLFQPSLDVAMQKSIAGYRYWFHRQLDYRQLVKS
jgi:peptide/nickel transport system substrate-binding protein